jgi:hypothetical protein
MKWAPMRPMLLAGSLLGAIGCDAGLNTATATRDSSGVWIVESRLPAWSDGEAWTIAAEPTLQIGDLEGDPDYRFFRIEAAVWLPDGGIIVANGGTADIKAFGQGGGHRWTHGGRGDAPGEYRLISGLGTGPGDSLWVYDFGLRRFTVLTTLGDVVRTVSVGANLSAANAVGRYPDGSFVVKESWSGQTHDNTGFGLVRQLVAVARFASSGEGPDTIATVPGREVFLGVEGRRMVMSAPLFGRNASAATHRGSLVLGTQEIFQIEFFSMDGILEQVARVLDVDLSITASDVADMKARVLARELERERAMMASHLDAMDLPSTRPAYGDLLIDQDGNVWASEYMRYPKVPHDWYVISSRAEFLGTVPMPDGFRLLDIRDDAVLGVWRDESDVQYIRVYPLEKPPRQIR